AYIPCDPEYPADRINLIMTDSEARFVITTADHASDYPSDKIILSEEIYNSGKTEKGDDENPGLDVSSEDLAYLIYTSGSTGRPKGVMLRHVGIANYLYDHPANVHIHGLVESGVKSFVTITTLSFDMSLKEFAGSLFNGITVILADEQEVKDAHMLASLMKRTGAEAINGTCSRILTYLELDEFREAVSHCKVVWAGGEQYPEQLLKALQGLGVRIFNTYGPTEITVSSNIAELTSASRVSVGRPLLNYEEFIVDEFDHPVPIGCTGELLVGGPGVALGYNNLPEMTAQRFVEYEGIRVYRTGDLARWRPDGEVEIIGRNDGQVKLRGFRVELGEVEGVAVKHPDIHQAVADIKEVGALQHLCLYYTSDSDIDDNAVSAFMARSLTEYMVPTIYMRLESIPLTPNGKVNRKALPKPEIRIGEIVLPGNETEQKVVDLLKEMLKVEELGVTTNLISLGFSSIAAMRLSAALLQKYGIRIPVQGMIAHPTVREMAQSVTGESGRTEYKAYPKRQHYPLSESQRGMLVDCLMNPDALQYNILYLLKYKTLDIERFKDALKAVADAHPYIKARIALSGGNYVQLRNDEDQLVVEDEVLDFEPDRAFFQSRVRPFKVLEDRLCRFNIFKTPTSYYLLIDIHHLISDGSSNYVLAREIERAYNGEKLEAEEYTAFDRAIDEESIMKSPRAAEAEQYFDGLLGGVSATSYPASSDVEAGATYCEIFEDISAAPVDEFCKSHSVAPSSFFFTVLHNVLHRLTREENTLVYFISNGRSEVQLENFFGVFVKTLPTVVSRFDIPLEESVKALHSQMMDTIAHDYYPFTRISERYGLKVEILYDYFVDLQTNLSLRGDAMNVSGLDLDTAKMPLSFTIIRNEAGDYRLSLEYDARLYGKADMKMLSAAFRTFALNCVEPSVSNLSQVELLTECEKNEIISLSRGADMDVDVKETFVSLFVKQAAATPDAVAVVGEDGTYTYRELDLRSNALANHLAGKGVNPGDFVCIEMFASSAFAVSMIAVQKAGAAYVPVDPSYPDDRRNFMKEDSGAAAVITGATFDEVDWSSDSPLDKARPGNPAYMIYTSGSTGRPKGVMVPHRGLLNFIHFTIKEWGLTAKSRISVHASVSFDASVEDLFPVLVAGGSLYPVPQDVRRDLVLMHDFLVKNGITGGNYSTQFGMMLVQTYPDLPLEYLNVGGEKMTSNPDCKYRLINTYGPTEFTDNSTYFILERGKQYRNIPIGRPLHNLSAYVLDKYGHLLPQGVPGELCMAGPQIALGYWHRDDLTAEKFIDCPFREGKMYRTG
ncbi:MAG: AMP-binding protein, partial [Bacteroidales bacterium]|nr:AMP-binding protein [Candidatus Hennigimonas equi]